MILKKLILLITLAFSAAIAQSQVCEGGNDSEDLLSGLNTIGKCPIEAFKESKAKEYVTIATRNRYVRKKNNAYINKLKTNLATATVAKKKTEKAKKPVVATTTKNTKVADFVRFDKVTEMPVFITCADFSDAFKEECKKETLVHYILDNLIYPFDAAAEGIHGRVWVRFIIDKDGYVTEITTKGPENGVLLEKEAKRLIGLLPKFIPGKMHDDYVNVEYFIPIDFELDEY